MTNVISSGYFRAMQIPTTAATLTIGITRKRNE